MCRGIRPTLRGPAHQCSCAKPVRPPRPPAELIVLHPPPADHEVDAAPAETAPVAVPPAPARPVPAPRRVSAPCAVPPHRPPPPPARPQAVTPSPLVDTVEQKEEPEESEEHKAIHDQSRMKITPDDIPGYNYVPHEPSMFGCCVQSVLSIHFSFMYLACSSQ